VPLLGSIPATGGFLVKVVADSTGAPSWVSAMSPFAHLHPVPLADVDWPSTAAMTALAATLSVAGAMAYQRRDLRG
jgi:ABC-2 type transport system permease protein